MSDLTLTSHIKVFSRFSNSAPLPVLTTPVVVDIEIAPVVGLHVIGYLEGRC